MKTYSIKANRVWPRASWICCVEIARGLKGRADFKPGAQSAGGGRRPRVHCLANIVAVCGTAQNARTFWERVWAVLRTASLEGRAANPGCALARAPRAEICVALQATDFRNLIQIQELPTDIAIFITPASPSE